MRYQSNSTLLIVDNDDQILLAFRELLGNSGFDIHTTWSGHEALALLKSGKFDVLLVDDYLPDLHAHDFLERVAGLAIQPWVVVMRDSTPKSTELRLYESVGVSEVVDKHNSLSVRQAVSRCLAGEPLARKEIN
jgi:CheY-like chemotaxis protein